MREPLASRPDRVSTSTTIERRAAGRSSARSNLIRGVAKLVGKSPPLTSGLSPARHIDRHEPPAAPGTRHLGRGPDPPDARRPSCVRQGCPRLGRRRETGSSRGSGARPSCSRPPGDDESTPQSRRNSEEHLLNVGTRSYFFCKNSPIFPPQSFHGRGQQIRQCSRLWLPH